MKFNTVNTRPEAYGFVGLQASREQLNLWLTQEVCAGGELYGAFKGIRLAGYASMLRLLLRALNGLGAPDQFPPRVLGPKPPRRWTVSLSGDLDRPAEFWIEGLRLYLQGRSSVIVEGMREVLGDGNGYGAFWQNLHLHDFEMAEAFFERGPKRNRALKEAYGLSESLLDPAQLDDLLVRRDGSREPADVNPQPRVQIESAG